MTFCYFDVLIIFDISYIHSAKHQCCWLFDFGFFHCSQCFCSIFSFHFFVFGMFSLINLNYLNIVIICFCFVKKDKNIRRPCCRRKRQGLCRPGRQQEQQKASPSFLENTFSGRLLSFGRYDQN